MATHNKLSQNQTINQFIETHGTKYDYSLVEYITSSTPVKIICPIHGIFEQAPSKHKKGNGCRKCKTLERANNQRKTEKQVIGEFIEVHGNIYDYSLVNYINTDEKVKIICPIHGIFEQKPYSHKAGSGCKKCNRKSTHTIETYRNRTTTLYYIKVNNLYKIGLTLKTVKSRYASDKEITIEILNEWVFEDGAIAYELEQQILYDNIEHAYFGEKILKGGNTELFTKNILENIMSII